ncbi:MAG: HTH domain-containing protein, partial [Bacteroidales bacterium]|nr:HTH domain-containing protein [Bacteroidales bacterium]
QNVPKMSPEMSPEMRRNDILNVTQKRREAIVKLIKEDNTITITDIAKHLQVTRRTILRELAEMRHIVQHVGPTRGGHWEFL